VILVLAMAIVFATAVLRGGDLLRLATLPLRRPALAIAALAAQVVLLSVLPAATPWGVAVVVHVGTYGLALAFVAINRAVPGLWILLGGGLCNLVAIAANGGVMPASASALAAVGRGLDPHQFNNAAPVAGAHLAFLGDVLPVPGPYPLGNVVSIGDLLLLVGAAVLVHRTCMGEPVYCPVTAASASSSFGRKRSGRTTHTA
jgi:hypothetical protein